MSSIMREDWIEVELQDVFETVTGNTPSKQEIDNYGQDIPFIKPPDITNSAIKSISEYLSNKGKLKARVLPSNSVLITCIGNLGRVGFNKDEVAFNQQINAILPTDYIDFKFTFYQAQSGSFRNQLESLSTSTTVALVNKSSFNSVKIEISPLPIQRAIVSKIEALFSDLDNGIANFKKAQEQLKIYRQAVLKKAFEGKLSEPLINNDLSDDTDFKSENEKSSKSFNHKNPSSDNLPKGWKRMKLAEVTEIVEKVKRKEKNDSEEFIYLDIGGIDNSINKIVSHKNYFWKDAPSRAQQIVKVGDTLFSTVRTYLKNIAFVEKEIYENQVCSSGFSVIRAKESVSIPKYLYYYSIFEEFIQPLNEMQKGSSYPAIRSEDVFVQFINIPPTTQEQTQIVQEIESRLSVCDKMEQSLSESIIKAEALRQSILKKAFEGKLLSQAEIEQCKKETDYEPASELLKKIKAEKLAKEQEKKKPTVKKESKK
jgi:type I restriction enzyme, S subunit